MSKQLALVFHLTVWTVHNFTTPVAMPVSAPVLLSIMLVSVPVFVSVPTPVDGNYLFHILYITYKYIHNLI